MGTAIEISIPRIETTIRISISVKPRRCLPLRVGCSIASLIVAVGIDAEHVLPAPGGGFRIVLHAALPPIFTVGHRVERNFAQEFYFLVHLVGDLHALDKNLQRFGITFGPYLERTEVALIGPVLVFIDRFVYFAQAQPHVALLFAADLAAR